MREELVQMLRTCGCFTLGELAEQGAGVLDLAGLGGRDGLPGALHSLRIDGHDSPIPTPVGAPR